MGGKSSSATTNQTFTEITTNTTSTVGDIGLTGDAAIEMMRIIEEGAIVRESGYLTAMEKIGQQQGEGFKQLMGGANAVITQGAAQNEQARADSAANSLDRWMPAVAVVAAAAVLWKVSA